jgi:nucleotide-binding universal stress UspA family protein
MNKQLLVAIDASDAAANAVSVAEQLARELKARIILLHVIDPLTWGRMAEGIHRFEPTLDQLHQEGEALLRDTRARLAPDLEVAVVLQEGSPADLILCEAADRDVDLIVLGTDSRGRLSHFLLGSTADAVIRRADRPVLSVRHNANCARQADEPHHAVAPT